MALVLEFKAKDKIRRNQIGWIKCNSEIWKLKKLWVKKAEGDKSGNEETWIQWKLNLLIFKSWNTVKPFKVIEVKNDGIWDHRDTKLKVNGV